MVTLAKLQSQTSLLGHRAYRTFQWGCFRFTPKFDSQNNPIAWEADCPFHRKSSSSGCRKTQAFHDEATSARVLNLLMQWCVAAPNHDRQWKHLTVDVHAFGVLPTAAIEARVIPWSARPSQKPLTDVELDLGEQGGSLRPQLARSMQRAAAPLLSVLPSLGAAGMPTTATAHVCSVAAPEARPEGRRAGRGVGADRRALPATPETAPPACQQTQTPRVQVRVRRRRRRRPVSPRAVAAVTSERVTGDRAYTVSSLMHGGGCGERSSARARQLPSCLPFVGPPLSDSQARSAHASVGLRAKSRNTRSPSAIPVGWPQTQSPSGRRVVAE